MQRGSTTELSDQLLNTNYRSSQSSRFQQSIKNYVQKEQKEQEKKIIYQHSCKFDQKKCIFNIVYQPITDPAFDFSITNFQKGPTISANQSPINNQFSRNILSLQKKPNILEIDIDMNQLQKYHPNLVIENSQEMSLIAEHLSGVIKINSQGQVFLDQAKINPLCFNIKINTLQNEKQDKENLLKLAEQQPNFTLEQIQLLQQSAQQKELSKTLHKTIKLFASYKYLITVYYIERPLPLFAQQLRENDIFEEYEVLLQIIATKLTNKMKPLFWEISMDSVFGLTKMTDLKKAAIILVTNLQIINDQFIFCITHFNDARFIKNPDIQVINEKSVVYLQRQFRNLKFHKNYKKFMQFFEQIKLRLIKQSLISDQKQDYMILIYEKDGKYFSVCAWDMSTYKRIRPIQINSLPFSTFLISQKTLLAKTMMKFLKIVKQNKIQEKILKFDFYGCLDSITNEMKASKLKKKIEKLDNQKINNNNNNNNL